MTEPLDDSPEGQLIRFVRGYAAKVEHEKIKERTMRGKLARVHSGKPPVGSRPPFGYRWKDVRDKLRKPIKVQFEEDPATAPIIRRIFNEIAAGSSCRQVARRLTDDGIPTPAGGKTRLGPNICKMVRHPTYTGNVIAWRWKKVKVKGRAGYVQTKRPDGEHIALPDGIAPALVTPEIAARVHQQVGLNKQQATRNNPDPEAYLLRGGIERCGYCGGAMTATNGAFGPPYRCNTYHRDRNDCPHFTIMAHILDSAVWEGIRDRLTRRDVMAAELHRLRTQDPTRGDLESLERRAGEVERRQRDLRARLADEDDADVAAMIREDLAALVNERRQLDQERDDLTRQREGWRLAQERFTELDLWVQNVAANLDDFDYSKRRLALTELGATVRV